MQQRLRELQMQERPMVPVELEVQVEDIPEEAGEETFEEKECYLPSVVWK